MADDATAAEPVEPLRYAIAIHGGAGVINSTNIEWLEAALAGLKRALTAGQEVLSSGGSALDAAVAAVVVLEEDPHFNAGKGSVLTRSCHHELEASVMTSEARCGAVTLLKRVRNPIALAISVMEQTPHILLSGPEAEALAESLGQELVDNSFFTTQQRLEQWAKYQQKGTLAPQDEIVQQGEDARAPPQQAHAAQQRHGGAGAAASEGASAAREQRGVEDADVAAQRRRRDEVVHHTQTVGAVAVDCRGRLAAATSTGGRTNKWDGRIGDTPLIGAGTWADKHVAISGTGIGEEFIRGATCHDVAARRAYKGISTLDAVREVVHGVMRAGDGGVVAVDGAYNVVMEFNSVGMYRGMADHTGRFETSIFQDGHDAPVGEAD